MHPIIFTAVVLCWSKFYLNRSERSILLAGYQSVSQKGRENVLTRKVGKWYKERRDLRESEAEWDENGERWWEWDCSPTVFVYLCICVFVYLDDPNCIWERVRQSEMRMTSDDEILLPPPVSGFSSDECSAEKKKHVSFFQISTAFVR